MQTTFKNKTNYKYAITLDEADIPAIIELQQKVSDNLPLHQKHFLKPRTAEDLKAHLDAGMPIIGVKSDGKLVASALLSFPYKDDAVKNLDGYPTAAFTGGTAIVQSYCSIEKGCGQEVLNLVQDFAALRGYGQLISKIAADNKASIKSFEYHGFKEVHCADAAKNDPVLGHPVVYMQSDTIPKTGAKLSRTAASSPMALIAEMA